LRITPLDIYQQEFKRVLRGLDPDEVEDFLERVADDYEQVIKENTALKERIESLEAQLDTDGRIVPTEDSEKAAREDASSIIREAKKEADNLIREARREADNVIRKAETNAEAIVNRAREIEIVAEEVSDQTARKDLLTEEAKTEEIQLRQEISKLRGQKERFLIEYRELLEKHLKILTEEV
jgi:DivIVA domain-containing protein